jgi:hypothetical protein
MEMESQYHRDFSLMFSKLSIKRQPEERVRNITGMDFTPENFVHAIQEHKRLAKQAQETTQETAQWRSKRMHLARNKAS